MRIIKLKLIFKLVISFAFAALFLLVQLTPLTLPKAHAEYRAFELAITNTETSQQRLVLSTLDHLQYPEYYPISQKETIAISATWMCWGPTDNFKRICPNPKSISANNP